MAEGASERVEEFVVALENHNRNQRRSGVGYADEIYEFNGLPLRMSDLRMILNEHRALRDAARRLEKVEP